MELKIKNKAFTLIELLVVIAIIGILSGTVIISMSGAQNSARDARIKIGMDQLRSSVQIYKLVSGSYYNLNSDPGIVLILDDIGNQGGVSSISIKEDGSSFCVESTLKSCNDFWCIDSNGYSGVGGCENYSCNYTAGFDVGGGGAPLGLWSKLY